MNANRMWGCRSLGIRHIIKERIAGGEKGVRPTPTRKGPEKFIVRLGGTPVSRNEGRN